MVAFFTPARLVAITGLGALLLLIGSLLAAALARAWPRLRTAAKWCGLAGAAAGVLHAALAFLLLLDAHPGLLLGQSYLRLGLAGMIVLMLGLTGSLLPRRVVKTFPLWKPVLLQTAWLGTLLAAFHALLAPFSNALWIAAALATIVLLRIALALRGFG